MNKDLNIALKKMKRQVLEGKVQVFCLTNIEFRYLRERENIMVPLLLEYGNPIIREFSLHSTL